MAIIPLDFSSQYQKARNTELKQQQLLQQQAQNARELELKQQQLDFNLAAPERAAALKEAERQRQADKTQSAMGIINGLAFGGANKFFNDKTIQDQLSKDKNYQAMSPEEQLAARNQFIQSNAGIFQDPGTYQEQVRKGLTQTNLFNLDEINKIASDATHNYFPTADKEVALKLLETGKNSNSGSTATGGYGVGNQKIITPPSNATQDAALRDNFMKIHGIRTGETGLFDEVTDFANGTGGYSVNNEELSKIESLGNSKGLTPYDMREAFGATMTDGESTMDPENLSQSDKKKLFAAAKIAKANRLQTMNTKTGAVSQNNASIMRQATNDRRTYNKGIVSSLVPHATAKADILNKFLSSLGSGYTPADPTSNNPVVVPHDNKSPGAPDTASGKRHRETAKKYLLPDESQNNLPLHTLNTPPDVFTKPETVNLSDKELFRIISPQDNRRLKNSKKQGNAAYEKLKQAIKNRLLNIDTVR